MFFKRKERTPKIKTDPDSIATIRDIEGKSFSTVTEILPDGTEKLLGRGGCANFTYDDHVSIVSNGTETFRCTVNSLRASLLMSGNGARIEGINDSGEKHKIIAIFNKMI